MATLVKKISVATTFGNKAVVRAAEDGPILRILGVMRGVQHGKNVKMDDNGNPIEQPWVAFIGQFQAVNIKTGEIFAAAKCFLPDVAASMIESAWADAQEGDDPADNLKFAFDITKKASDNSATGYEYGAIPLMEQPENDPLSEMAKTLPALPSMALPEPEAKGNKK